MRTGGHSEWSAILEAASPDLLFVQESKDPASFALDLLSPIDLGVHSWAPVEHGRWGSGISVKGGALQLVAIPDFTGWVVGGQVTVAGLEFFAFSVHLPSRGSYLKAGHQLLDRLGPIIGESPFVLGGDWNFTTSQRAANEGRKNTKHETAFLARMRDDFGAQSGWREGNPIGPLPQTLRWTGNPSEPYHCDGMFFSESMSFSVSAATVLSGEPWLSLSDHNPMVVEGGLLDLGRRDF